MDSKHRKGRYGSVTKYRTLASSVSGQEEVHIGRRAQNEKWSSTQCYAENAERLC